MESKLNKLHAYLDQAQPPEQSTVIRRQIDEDPELQQMQHELQELNLWVQQRFEVLRQEAPIVTKQETIAAFERWKLQERTPAPPVRPHVERKVERNRWYRGWVWPAWASVCLLAGLLFWSPWSTESTKDPPFIAKGGTPSLRMLHAHRQYHSATKTWQPAAYTRPGTELHPGDLVQFSIQHHAPLHVMVVSLNQKGQVFAYFPLQGKHSQMLPAGSHIVPQLGHSLELDQELGEERFFIIVSHKPFLFAEVRRRLKAQWHRHNRSLRQWRQPPGHWFSYSLLIRKTNPPKRDSRDTP